MCKQEAIAAYACVCALSTFSTCVSIISRIILTENDDIATELVVLFELTNEECSEKKRNDEKLQTNNVEIMIFA